MLRVRLAFRNRLYAGSQRQFTYQKRDATKSPATIEQLGYVYNRFAANLRSQKR